MPARYLGFLRTFLNSQVVILYHELPASDFRSFLRDNEKMKSQKCCAHCPGTLVSSSSNEIHDCSLPKYVRGNLRISSLQKEKNGTNGGEKRTMRRVVSQISDDPTSCYDQFALAKKLHAENLDHQPLPDRVDDSLFKDPKPRESCRRLTKGKCTCVDHHDQKMKKAHRYGPVLGCKKPETRMDLAICWETPINPNYEPQKSTHIDGSEGGSAPAIFALVHHTPNSTKASIRSEPTQLLGNPETVHVSDCPRDSQEMGTQTKHVQEEEDDIGENKISKSKSACCCECLCRKLNDVALSKCGYERRSRSERPHRKCIACAEKEGRQDDPRLMKSAVGLALGLEKTVRKPRNNVLPSKISVPRPKTPFARRSFCIDTLSPPFSVVNGCRDADYPEHWRLMSIYQQSYRNPQKRRTPFHC